jgi:hypothetical protein
VRPQARCVLLQDVPFPASQFSSVPDRKVREWVRRVRRFAPASVVPCILRARVLQDRDRLESVRAFPLPGRLVPAVARVRLRAAPVSAMFRVA